MRISIVTVVLDRAGSIGRAMESLAAQSFQDYEHIIQDGGSTDGTLEVIARHADARTRLVSERDAGIYDAINRGMERATGDVVGLLHSDDVFASQDALQLISEGFRDQEVAGVYGDLTYISAKSGRVVRRWTAEPFRPQMMARGWMPPHPTLFLRSSVMAGLGRYDPDFRISGDYEMVLRLLGRGYALAYLPHILVAMSTGGASNRSLGAIWRKMREDAEAARRHGLNGPATVFFKNARKIRQLLPGLELRLPGMNDSAAGAESVDGPNDRARSEPSLRPCGALSSVLGKCAVVHAGNRDGYEAASALAGAGYQVHLITDYYQDDTTIVGRLMRRVKGAKVDFRRKPGLDAVVHIGLMPMVLDYLHQRLPRSTWVTRLKARALADLVRKVDRREDFRFIVFYFNSGLHEFVADGGPDRRLVLFQMHPHPGALRDIYRAYLERLPPLAAQMAEEEEEIGEDEEVIARLSQEADLASHIICPSSFVKQSLVRYGIDPARISQVGYGAPPPRSCAALADQEPADRSDPGSEYRIRLAFVGQFVLRKGVFELVRFVATRSDVWLTIYTRDADYAERRLREWGVEAANIAIRSIRNHDALWASAVRHDFLILPSLAEGFGLVITEALSAGLPVIATASTCAADLIQDGRSGYMLASEAIDALENTIARACEDKLNWPKMRAVAMGVAAANSWGHFAKDFTDAIARAVDVDN